MTRLRQPEVIVRGRTVSLPQKRPAGVRAAGAWTQRGLETAMAVVISIAGLGTSWSSYQAALWNSRQAIHFGTAGGQRTEASRAALDAEMKRVVDIGLFSAWMDAEALGDRRRAGLYERRFTPELKAAFAEWIAQDPMDNPQAAQSPFVLGSYRQPKLTQAEAMDGKADAEFQAGMRANGLSNAYTRGAVVLALAMFIAGVGQVFRRLDVRIVLAIGAVIACGYGLQRIFNLPSVPPP